VVCVFLSILKASPLNPSGAYCAARCLSPSSFPFQFAAFHYALHMNWPFMRSLYNNQAYGYSGYVIIRRALPICPLRQYRLLILAHGVIMEHDTVGSCSRTQPQQHDSWHIHNHRHSWSTSWSLCIQIALPPCMIAGIMRVNGIWKKLY